MKHLKVIENECVSVYETSIGEKVFMEVSYMRFYK